VLYDIGVVPTEEPFQRLYNPGMILGANNEKMSKSKGNVVNPDDIVESHGADTLRVYEMFMGPLEASIAWSEEGLDGARRFLDRIWRLFVTEDGHLSEKVVEDVAATESYEKTYHQTVQKVTEDYENLRFNTAISQLMVFINESYKQTEIPKAYVEGFTKLLSPLAPHIAEELWEILGNEPSVSLTSWPTYDPDKLVESTVEIVIQVNGKVRSKLTVPKTIDRAALEEKALADDHIKEWLQGKTVRKVIVVPGKLVNIVAN